MNQTRNLELELVLGRQPGMPHIHPTPDWRTPSLHSGPPPWPPANLRLASLHESPPTQLPSAPGRTGEGPKHPDDSPPWLRPQDLEEFNFTENQLPFHEWELESETIF